MRILQVHNRHEEQGGADAVVAAERAQLEGAGHHVRQVLYGPASQIGLNPLRMGLAAVWNPTAVGLVREAITEFSPDVVHVHTPFPVVSPAVFRACGDLPRVMTAHSFRLACIAGTCRRSGTICEDCIGSRTKLSGIRHRCYHKSLPGSASLTLSLVGHRALGTFSNQVDRYIALTPFARDLLVRDGFRSHKVTVKPNAVADPGSPIPASDREPFVLFVGRLVEEKGVRTLLNAWRGCDWELRVAGDGPLRALVDEAARGNPAIRPLGWRSEDELRELQATATATVVPSEWYEAGEPLVLLQALAAGTPSISCDLENISGVVAAREAGWTFKTADAASLRGVVDAVRSLRHGDVWQLHSRNARALYLDKHTPSASLRGLEDIYRGVLVERGKGRTVESVGG